MRRTLWIATALLPLLILFNSPVRADRASEDAWLAEVRDIWAHAGDNTAWDRVEGKALLLAQGRATRDGPDLTLDFGKTGSRIYSDRKECRDPEHEERCQMFRLEAHLPTRHLFVLAELFYEGSRYRVIDDRTGRETILDAEPRFGPDPAVFLVIDDDVAYGSGREIQMWRRKKDGAVREWMREAGSEPTPHHVDIVRWDQPEEIVLEMRTEAWLDHPQQRWPAFLKRDHQRWRIEMNPPPQN